MELLEEELISLGIGGMRSQFVQILHQAFGSRMVSPAEAKRLNLRHVRGMLLYGPTGSGKTLIARNICKLLNAKEPLLMNGSDFVNDLQGASLRRMRSLFKAAIKDGNRYGLESDLHVIIIDGIDSIAKKRGTMGYYRLDDRLVNQLVTMIDGMKALNNIFIIATSDREDLIEEALLREGRIELHVKVDYPDEQGRLQILDIQTTGVRQASMLDKDVNLQEIARRTDGYSGAALASLVTRAHSYTLVQLGKGELLNMVEEDVKITMNHFLLALEDFKSRRKESGLEPNRKGQQKVQLSDSTGFLHIQEQIARLKVDSAHFQTTLASQQEEDAKLEMKLILQQFSPNNSAECLRIQQGIARLKVDKAHFQATLTSCQEEHAKLEMELIMQQPSSRNSIELLQIPRELARLKVDNADLRTKLTSFQEKVAKKEMELLSSSSQSTEFLRIQEEIMRLKEDNANFQATMASNYQVEKANFEMELETFRGKVRCMELSGVSRGSGSHVRCDSI